MRAHVERHGGTLRHSCAPTNSIRMQVRVRVKRLKAAALHGALARHSFKEAGPHSGRTRMNSWTQLFVVAGIGVALIAAPAAAQDAGMKKWTKGKGWGWVWGAEDEVG